jgi:hypothetical protein
MPQRETGARQGMVDDMRLQSERFEQDYKRLLLSLKDRKADIERALGQPRIEQMRLLKEMLQMQYSQEIDKRKQFISEQVRQGGGVPDAAAGGDPRGDGGVPPAARRNGGGAAAEVRPQRRLAAAERPQAEDVAVRGGAQKDDGANWGGGFVKNRRALSKPHQHEARMGGGGGGRRGEAARAEDGEGEPHSPNPVADVRRRICRVF